MAATPWLAPVPQLPVTFDAPAASFICPFIHSPHTYQALLCAQLGTRDTAVKETDTRSDPYSHGAHTTAEDRQQQVNKHITTYGVPRGNRRYRDPKCVVVVVVVVEFFPYI